MNKGEPSNRIISRKFVETVIIVLFIINLIASITLLVMGIVSSTKNQNDALYYYISSASIFLGCCIFLSFLIVHILKVCELEKINCHLEAKKPRQSTTELLTVLSDLYQRGVIAQEEYEKERQSILKRM